MLSTILLSDAGDRNHDVLSCAVSESGQKTGITVSQCACHGHPSSRGCNPHVRAVFHVLSNHV
jgi:hypothetical protein